LDFLKYSGIIPSDWELAQAPVTNSQVAHISFTNSINFVAQPGTITFSENISNKTLEKMIVPKIASSYTQKLPNANYQGLSINPGSFLTFPDLGNDAAGKYIVANFLSPQIRGIFDHELTDASINLTCKLERGKLNLSISQVKLNLPKQQPQLTVLVSGNFPYIISGKTPQEKLQYLHQLIDNWQTDLEIFREVVWQKFLSFPTVEKEVLSHSENEFNWQMADNNN
jgi:hypothetical protein